MAVKNYSLGKDGVVVDKSPIHSKSTELLKAQNAIRDRLGIDGGLKNRPGLVKFNSSAAAGSIIGGIAMPVGGIVDARTLYLAQKTAGAVESWYTSSNLFVASAVTTTIGAWQDPTAYFSPAADVSRMGEFYNGQLYYAGYDYTSGATSPVIRVFNGSDDREVSKILPKTALGVISMVASKGYLHILTLDSGTTDADFVGRVFRLSPNGHMTQVGDAIGTGHVPISLAIHNNMIFVGTARLTTTNEARIYRINPIDETTWTLEHTCAADDYMVTSLCSFAGLLYGTTKNGGGATKGKVLQRSNAGVWSTVDSTVANTGTYESLAVFNGKLYASSRNYDSSPNISVIRRTSDGSSWATVYNSATASVGLFHVIGLRLFSIYNTVILHTTNGTDYTSATPTATGTVTTLGVLLRGEVASSGEPGSIDYSEPVSSDDEPTQTIINHTTGPTQVIPYTKNWFHIYPDAGSGTATIELGQTANDTGTPSNVTDDSTGTYHRKTGSGSSGGGMRTSDWTWWEHQPMFECYIRTDTVATNLRYYILLCSGAAYDQDDNMANRLMIGLRYSTAVPDAGWVPVTADATTQTVSSSIMAFAVDTRYKIRIAYATDTSAAITITNMETNASASTTVAVSGLVGVAGAMAAGCYNATATNGRYIEIRYMYGERI